MAKPSSKTSILEKERGEGPAHEMKETPHEEIREGSEAQEGEYGKKSKRARKRTKAPMDGESCACSSKKGEKCSCDSSCGKKMDALTPQEYLAACDLGIQDRSRSYIRTRLTVMDSLTPASLALRFDKKCGGSAIPDNKTCRVGMAGSSSGRTLRKVGTAAAIAGGVGLAAYGASRMRRGGAPALPTSAITRGNTIGNRVRRGVYSARQSLTNRPKRLPTSSLAVRRPGIGQRARSAVGMAGSYAKYQGRRAASGAQSLASRLGQRRSRPGALPTSNVTRANTLGNRARRAAYGVSSAFRRRDAIWADGFTPDTLALEV